MTDTAAAGPELRRFMRRWPGGLAVVTTASAREPHATGCTVSAFMSVSLRPPLVLVSLAAGSRTLSAVTEHGAFCVNVLGAHQRDLADHFATAPGDRFAGVAHRWVDGLPVLEGTVATAACAVDRIVPAADHALVLGTPRHYRMDGSLDPVVFFEGAYYTLPDHPCG